MANFDEYFHLRPLNSMCHVFDFHINIDMMPIENAVHPFQMFYQKFRICFENFR